MICYALLFLYHTVDQMGQDNRFSIKLTIIEVLGLTVIHSLCLPVCQQLKNNNKQTVFSITRSSLPRHRQKQ